MDRERIAKKKEEVRLKTIRMGDIDKELMLLQKSRDKLLRKKSNLAKSISDNMLFINGLINLPST